MTQNWLILYTTQNLPHANIIKGMLEENGIPVIILNKQDSSYLNFGDIELQVPIQHLQMAKELLENANIM